MNVIKSLDAPTVLFSALMLFLVGMLFWLMFEASTAEYKKSCGTVISIGGCNKDGICGTVLNNGTRSHLYLPTIGQEHCYKVRIN